MNKPKSSTSNSPKKSAVVRSSPSVKEKTTGSVSAVKDNKRSTPTPIENVGQLLDAFYVGKFKRSTLNAKERGRMREVAKLDEGKRTDLLSVAKSDRTLSKTRELMLFCIGLDEPIITKQVWEFCGLVINRHPAFKNSLSALTVLPEVAAVEKITNNDYSTLSWPSKIKPLTKGEQEQCKLNAVHCLLLWLREKQALSLDRIQHILQVSLWSSISQKHSREKDKIRALLSTKDFYAAPIVCAMLKESVGKANKGAAVALQKKEEAEMCSQKLYENLAKVRKEMEETKVRESRFEKELAQEKQLRINDTTHLKDDYEQLRGRVLRCLKGELSLLDEGLHALQRESPKVHVMIDHAERAIDGLKREIERLRVR